MIIYSAKFPWKPPSINQLYSTYNGLRLLSREARAYKKNVADFAAMTYSGKMRTDLLCAHIIHRFGDKRRRDATNYHKALLDALEGIVYVDDRQLIDVRMQIEFCDEYSTEIKIYTIDV